jgi:hypothetical protein
MITKLAVHTVAREHAEEAGADGRSSVLLRPLNSASRTEIERLARVLFRGAEGSVKAILFAGIEDDGCSSEWVPLHMGHTLASNGRPAHVLCLQRRSEVETAVPGEKLVVLSDRCKVLWLSGVDAHEDLSQIVGQHLLEARKSGAQALVHVANLPRRAEVLSCSRLLDGAALLVRSGQTRKVALAAASQQLAAADLAVLGGILTNQTHPIPEKIYRML